MHVCPIAEWSRFFLCVVGSTWLALTSNADEPVQLAFQPPAQAEKPPAPADIDDPRVAEHFSGQVLGPDDKPVARARMYLLQSNHREMLIKASVVVGADGRFKIESPDITFNDLRSRRGCVVMATAEGFGPDWIEVDYRPLSRDREDPAKGVELALRLVPEDVPIHGRFLDPEGKPLAGAQVQIRTLYRVPQEDLDAYLDRMLKGNIFMDTSSYQTGIEVPRILPGMITTTQTDSEGRFTLSGIGRNRLVDLKVSALNVVDSYLRAMTRNAPDAPILRGGDFQPANDNQYTIYGAGFTLPLKAGRTIEGRVIDRDSRQPIPGMWVGAGYHDGPVDLSLKHTTTGNDGRFKLTGIAPIAVNLGIVAASPPGMPYITAAARAAVRVEQEFPVVIECQRGIPFRLKLVDEQGQPVEARVIYDEVQPNPLTPKREYLPTTRPRSVAARRADGSYEGFVLPGPGAVLVQAVDRFVYRPAYVDPKAFFAPGRTNWTAQEMVSDYGTRNTLSMSGQWFNQNDYDAIVLVSPAPDSAPLELSATVVKDRPRVVSLVDSMGQPFVGAKTQGFTGHPNEYEPPLRGASALLTRLHPDRVRRITFFDSGREMIGSLVARGDDETPYIVKMQPWATITGRLIDQEGKPMKASLSFHRFTAEPNPDPEVGEHVDVATDDEGQFRIERFVPGLRYTAKVYQGTPLSPGTAFVDLVLKPGEVRHLGEIRIPPRAAAGP